VVADPFKAHQHIEPGEAIDDVAVISIDLGKWLPSSSTWV